MSGENFDVDGEAPPLVSDSSSTANTSIAFDESQKVRGIRPRHLRAILEPGDDIQMNVDYPRGKSRWRFVEDVDSETFIGHCLGVDAIHSRILRYHDIECIERTRTARTDALSMLSDQALEDLKDALYSELERRGAQ
ncbi:hypothetical protein ACFQJC_04835 [Haloferax namakaokahaiae]|uniref:Uncharacterized protein n=1 Tax=Haloferax namakaokahaiae TaxID=1748331 RepID=A0ABD5ZC39_9EURY